MFNYDTHNMFTESVIDGVVRASFSDEVSYDFFKDVYMRSVDHPEPLRIAVVAKGDDVGPSMCVWALHPFTETLALGGLYGGDSVFKPIICICVAQAELAIGAPNRKELIVKIMDGLFPMVDKFIGATRAGIFDLYMANTDNANFSASILQFQESLCTVARESVRRCLTEFGVARSPAPKCDQMREVVDLLTDPATGYFDTKVSGSRSFTLKERRTTPTGYPGGELEVMVSFDSECDAQLVAKAHTYVGEGLVIAPNCDRAKVHQSHWRCEPLYEMLGLPLEFLAIVLPRFLRDREALCSVNAIGSPFAPELKFEAHGYGWHVTSVCGHAIADREARKKAIEAVSRVVGANLERIKAKLWRPRGPLCAKMLMSQGLAVDIVAAHRCVE